MDEEIQKLWALFNDGGNVDQLRHRLAGAIQKTLDELQDRLGYWEASHLASAVSLLSANVQTRTPTLFLLGICLSNLELSRVAAKDRNEHYVPHKEDQPIPTYEDLIDLLRQTGF